MPQLHKFVVNKTNPKIAPTLSLSLHSTLRVCFCLFVLHAAAGACRTTLRPCLLMPRERERAGRSRERMAVRADWFGVPRGGEVDGLFSLPRRMHGKRE